MVPRWRAYANDHFLLGIDNLALPEDAVPRLDEVNRFLKPLTGFQAKAVSGYLPAFAFFDCLRERTFPTTITIRHGAKLDYLPEPDIFHDVFGHVPMHAHPVFADFLARYNEFEEHLPQWKQQYPRLASADMRYEGQIVLEMQPGTTAPGTAATDAKPNAAAIPGTPAKAAVKAEATAQPAKPVAKPVVKAAGKPVAKPVLKPAHAEVKPDANAKMFAALAAAHKASQSNAGTTP